VLPGHHGKSYNRSFTHPQQHSVIHATKFHNATVARTFPMRASYAQIGADTARIQRKAGGYRGGEEAQARSSQKPTAIADLNARIAEIGADSLRAQAVSSECLWICHRVLPPLLPEPETPTTETNPLRRQDGEPIKRR
jgi:hypothetical protein